MSGAIPIRGLHAAATGLRVRLRPSNRMLLTLLAAFATAAGASAMDLTERAAVEHALSRPAFQDVEQGRVAVAESVVTESSYLPNPVVSIGRERQNVPGERSTESTYQIAQTFDLSGRRALKRGAAEQRLQATREEQRERRFITTAEVRRAFADMLYRDQVKSTLLAWLDRFQSVNQTVGYLAKAGEVSGYDRRRLAREMQTAKARLASAEADLSRARALLAGYTNTTAPAQIKAVGMLLPDAPQGIELFQNSLRQRPDLLALHSQLAAYDRERRAAERAWVPDLTVGVGQKRVEDRGRSDNGVMLSLSMPLPLFDRGQASRTKAGAQVHIAQAEHALLLQKAEADLKGVWQQAIELRGAAETFRSDSLADARELSRIAQSAYRAGEGGILELLDAYRAELDADMLGLDLELRARLALIELDLLAGTNLYE